jgi:hypothetical protein
MNKLIPAAVIAAAFALPAISYAQGTTRADVRAQLVELEQVGYNPASNDLNYPHDVQAAQARVDAVKLAAGNTSGYGAPATGTSQAGAARPAAVAPQQSVYFGN